MRSKPAIPNLQVTSIPTVIASSTSLGLEFSFDPTARAAETTDALGCKTEGKCVSSKSSECAKVPFKSAADELGNLPAPIAKESAGPAHADTTFLMISATGSSVAASEFPITSKTRREDSRRNSRDKPF